LAVEGFNSKQERLELKRLGYMGKEGSTGHAT
jgi:hypothetical protein